MQSLVEEPRERESDKQRVRRKPEPAEPAEIAEQPLIESENSVGAPIGIEKES